MKTLLLITAIVGMTLASCEKETIGIPVPVPEDAKWTLTIAGEPLDSFRVVFYSSVVPYSTVDYTGVIGGTSPIVIEMEIGQTYAVKYMDIDSTFKLIQVKPTDRTNVYNSVPATMFYN